MSDKELLIKAFEQYAKNLASSMFGLNSIPTQAVISYLIKNMIDKYEIYIDLFVDKNGNINVDMLAEAAKEEIKRRGGVKIGNIKFTDKDIDELLNTYKVNKKSN